MKKLLFLVGICFVYACTEITSSPFIVTEVKRCNSCKDNDYTIIINNQTTMFTNKLYQVGDTLK